MLEAFEPVKQAVAENRLRLAIQKPKARKLLILPTPDQRRWAPAGLVWFARALGVLFIGSSLAAAYAWLTWELMHMIFACTISLVSLRYLDRIAAHFTQDKALSDEAFFHAGRESGLIELEPVTGSAESR
ncbi:MAG: hypothetical protein AB1451_07400 [Nitrospirota bacterium]